MTCWTGDDGFAAFDIVLRQRGRGRWKWSVRSTDGHPVMCGSECSRDGARYKAQRALFLLLCASASCIYKQPLKPTDLGPGAAGRSKNAGTSEMEEH